MPDSTPSPRRGRPKRHPIDVLFAQIWFCAVQARSGLPSAYAIELDLEPHLVRRSADGQWRPRKWDAYEAGRRVPKRRKSGMGSIEIAEARFPGTVKYLESPLRTLLRKPAVSLRWIDDQLLALSEPVVDLLFEPRPASSTVARHLRPFDGTRAWQLATLGGFDSLVASVLLMKRAELIPSPEMRGFAWAAYLKSQPSVLALPEVAPMAAELFLAIDAGFPRWLYLRPDQRAEVVLFTNALRDDEGVVDPAQVLAQDHLARSILTLDRQLLEHALLESGKRPVPLTDLIED